MRNRQRYAVVLLLIMVIAVLLVARGEIGIGRGTQLFCF